MANRVEAIAQKEQSLRVVEQVSPGEQEAIKDKGGFQIPLGLLAQSSDREILYQMAREVVRQKFLEAIGCKE
jgi:hypothetical protein